MASPLPRWAPTPSPTRPLWRWGGGTPDAHHPAAGGVGTGWWSLASGVFAWVARGGRHRDRGTGDDRACGGGVVPAGSGCELQVVVPSSAAADAGAPRAFLTWEDVRVTVAGGGPRGAPDVRILDGISGHARPGEVLAILGPSGGGKTTLLDTLAGRSPSPVVERPARSAVLRVGRRRTTRPLQLVAVDRSVAMAGTPSPLPRWAPTPSPSWPLWRWGGGGTPDDANNHHQPGGRGWWWSSSLPSGGGGGVPGRSGCELQVVEVPSSADADADAGGGDPRAFLTWEDVRVTVAGGGGPRGAPDVRILDGISGHARPGEVVAIMGPSGGGKTTLLDTLAGRLGPGMNKKGLILINGRQEKLAYGTSAYVTQDNVLMSTLSVREAVYYSAQLQLPDTMPLPEKRAHAERVIRELGLGDAMDTRIGGRITKGISGGQRKRLSICIEMLTRPRLLFLDEPTSGLDSAASYHVMSHIARVAARDDMTVVAAVHQPSGDVFELFHGLCLLAAGRTVFFGTISDATEFFTLNGFPCPHLRSPSDHFLRTINKDFDEETVESSKTQRKTAAEAIEILATAYRSSDYIEKTTNQIVEMKNMDGASFRRREQASFATKLLVLTRRSFLNMHRDIGYYWMRLGIYMGIGVCLGTIFYQVGYSYSSIQSRCSIIMYTIALLTFMAIGGFPSFVEDVKVFRKERLSGHYGVSEFVISNTLSATPYLSVIAVLPGAMLYYLTGLTKGVDHFIYFVMVVCLCCLLVESMMMVIAAIVPDFLMGIIVGAGVQGVMMLNGGFFRLPNELPKPVWKYPSYYISFHKYAVQGLYKNEFMGLSFPSDQLIESNVTISGIQVLKRNLQVEMGYSKWVNLAILCGMLVIYRMMFFAIVKITEEIRQKRGGKRGCVR